MSERASERQHRVGQAMERLRQRRAGAQDGWLFAQIAGQVADRRGELGLSRAELDEVCGTTQSAIARLGAGDRPPRIDTLLKLAHALDCQLAVDLHPLGLLATT